ncbi:MAG: hypothetical protein Q8R82_07815 [Hyphomonadaceae bacterium]|nr:hypothetical protein [Hyphomonadaceae bacterium]
MTFKRGSFVSYGGRAAEVQGVQPFTLPSGHTVDCLVLVHTGQPRGLVRVPLDRVADTVRPISKAEAEHMDANVVGAVTRSQNAMQRARAAAAAKAADYGRMGALAKARNQAA